jgi:hypothetical protein
MVMRCSLRIDENGGCRCDLESQWPSSGRSVGKGCLRSRIDVGELRASALRGAAHGGDRDVAYELAQRAPVLGLREAGNGFVERVAHGSSSEASERCGKLMELLAQGLTTLGLVE